MGRASRAKRSTSPFPSESTISAAPATRSDALRLAIVAVLLCAAVAIVYAQVRTHDYINLDDPQYASENPYVAKGLTFESIRWAFTTLHASYYQPVTWLSLMTDSTLFGHTAGVHAAVNAALHALSAILCLLWLWRSTGAFWRSSMVAMLFAVHPAHVESVAWVTERKDVLSTVFLFLTLLLYSRYAESRSRAALAGSIAAFAVGLLAKPMLVTVPFVLLLLDYWPFARFNRLGDIWPLVREKWAFFVLSIMSAAVTLVAQRVAMAKIESIPFAMRLGNAAISMTSYLEKLFWPSDLAAFYPYARRLDAAAVAASFIVVIVLSIVAFAIRDHFRYLFVGWFWFIGTLIPVIGIVQVGRQAMADRFTYVPYVGLFIAIVWGVAALVALRPAVRPAIAAAAVACVVALGWRAHAQAALWQDSVTLFQHTTSVTRDNAFGYLTLGAAYAERGDFRRAADAYRAAIKADPRSPDAVARLAEAELALGEKSSAEQRLQIATPAMIEDLRRRISIAPNDAATHNDLAVAYTRSGDDAGALKEYNEALRLNPELYDARMNRGALLSRMERNAEASADFATAARLHPRSPEPLVYAALADANRGAFRTAIEYVDRALKLDEAASNSFFTNAVRMPPAPDNLRRYRAFLGQQPQR